MKRITRTNLLPALLLALPFLIAAQEYRYSLDLQQLPDDRLHIRLDISGLPQGDVLFHFPRIVPGIYGAMDFGRNIVRLRAWGGSDTLPVERLDINTWRIAGAERLSAVTYEVNDGWDAFSRETTQGFYKSAESSFTANKVFVINHNCLFGFFKGGEQWPVRVEIRKPASLYGATSLPNRSVDPGTDLFEARNYRELVDHPVLYAAPDTTHLHLGNTVATVACFSDSGNKLSANIARLIAPLLENQRQYLGGSLPVDRYTFLFYHAMGDDSGNYTFDGLEHSTSTLCLLNAQLDPVIIESIVYGIASHEFLHIVTPLNVHSEEIAAYDFIAPKMSQHLWLYEGITEYCTMHMPVWQGLQPLGEFLETIRKKARHMQQFDNSIPLTVLSKQALERQDQYYNFYLRGALAGLCLDIRLRELSSGKYGVRDLMRDLSQRYGKNSAFQDEVLFDVITSMTFPEIRDFFRDYVEGAKPLPLGEYLARAGIIYNERRHSAQPEENPTAAQATLRQWWLGR